MESVQRIAAEKEKQLRQLRWGFTEQLARRDGAFWGEVKALRERWEIDPSEAVPSSSVWRWFGVSLHPPLDLLLDRGDHPTESATWEDAVRLHVAGLGPLGQWLRDIRQAYERLIPESERRRDGLVSGGYPEWLHRPSLGEIQVEGNLFETHWAAFISGCALFDPPKTELIAFANHVVLSAETIAQSEAARKEGKPPQIDVPGVLYLPDAAAAAAQERRFIWSVLAPLAVEYADRGIDLLGDIKRVMLDPTWLLENRDLGDPIPVHAVLDPSPSINRDTLLAARRHLLTESSRGGRPELDPLETLQTQLLKEQGLDDLQIAERLGLARSAHSYDTKRRSNKVQGRLRREHKHRSVRKNPGG